MKIKKNQVGILFTVMVGYFLIYFATHKLEVYIPVGTADSGSKPVIVLDAGHGAFS